MTLVEEDARFELRKAALGWCIASLVFAIPLGIAFVAAIRKNAPFFVKATCVFQVIAMFFIFPMLGIVFAVGFYYHRAKLVLVGSLLKVAGAALTDNGHLITASLLIQALYQLAWFPLVITTLFASKLQVMVRNRYSDLCHLSFHPAVYALWIFVSIIVSWITAFAYELRLFTIAHVVLRWYELPLGARLEGRPVREAMSAGLGPHSGSLSLGSAILVLCEMIRAFTESLREVGGIPGKIIGGIIAFIIDACVEWYKEMTRFATVYLAATGKGFMEASRSSVALMERNMLEVYAVWRFPPLVLGLASFMFSLVGSLSVAFIFFGIGLAIRAAHKQGSNSDFITFLWRATAIVGSVSLVNFYRVIYFLASTLLHIVDALYVAWATDLDNSVVKRPEVHAIFALMPSVHVEGAVVQQPDSELGYAPGVAPGQQEASCGLYVPLATAS